MTLHSDTIGIPKTSLDTPSLLVHLEVMQKSIRRMSDTIIRDAGVQWRPHTKGIKVPAIAHQLLDAGAIGVTCAKLGEAEIMAAAGIRDILIANQVVGDQKVARLVNLQRQADVIVAVDNLQNIEGIGRAAVEIGVEVRVLIEVDTGMNRAGLLPGEPVLAMAKQIQKTSGVHLAGLMTWESVALRILDSAEKKKVVTKALEPFIETADLCRAEGVSVEILSCGGTGTYWISAFHPGITEIQAGGGIFGDLNYSENFGVDHPYALTVLATVTSRPADRRIILDAGRKALAQAVLPKPVGINNVDAVKMSAEHGIILLSKPSESPRVGDKIELIVGYGDVTVALHDEMYGIRNGCVEATWPILGRGKLR